MNLIRFPGKCDDVIEQLMSRLNIDVPQYSRDLDPIFYHATQLHETETHTTTRIPIEKSSKLMDETSADDESNSNLTTYSSNEDSNLETKIVGKSDDACSNDLISANNLKLEKLTSTKAEDANSDKENDVKSMLNEMQIKAEEKCGDEDEVVARSPVSVIKNEIQEECIVPETSTHSDEVEDETESIDNDGETETNMDEGSLSVSRLMTPSYTTNNYLSVGYGWNNLWSDLSVFDVLTQRPVFLGPTFFGWNGGPLGAYSTLIPLCPSNDQSMVMSSYFNYSNVNESLVTESDGGASNVEMKDKQTETDTIVCLFCYEQYDSSNCLFYTLHESNEPLDTSSACLCCDGDEEDDQDDLSQQEEDIDKNIKTTQNVNPGWFGKGWRKKLKKRR